MITPSFGLTATERVLPKLALDFTTASLDSRITFTRTTDATHPATYVNSSGYVTAATNNQARFDYSPTALTCKGLLIEESRTNLCLYSENISQAPWAFTRANYVLDATTSPANTSTADKLYESTAASNTHYVNTTFVGASGTTYTASIFLKAGERTQFRLRFTGTASFADVYFDLSAGTILTTVAGSGTITSYGNGWYRCTITGASDLTGTCSFINYLCVNGTSIYTGDGSSGAYLWGAQLEAGAFATSYIPTTTTALTRNADVATMTGTNFSDWYNATEGAFSTTFSNDGYSSFNSVFFAETSATQQIGVGLNSSRVPRLVVENTTNQVNQSYGGALVTGLTYTVCAAYKVNNFGIARAGGATVTDTSGTVPTVSSLTIGHTGSARFLNGHIKKLLYWPQRIINAEVQAFSK